jgi:sulfur carrier protein
MQLTVNGNTETVGDGVTILDFLAEKKLDPEKVVVEHNLDIVQRETYGDVVLKDNDSLEILRFVGGG